MSGDRQRAKKTQCRREFPTLAEKKKVSPKPPGGQLRRDKQRGLRFDTEDGAEQAGQRRISRKKRDVGNFHHLVIDGRNDRLIAAVDDIREPITIVLDQTCVAIGKRTFRRQQKDSHDQLDERQQESRRPRSKERKCADHNVRTWEG